MAAQLEQHDVLNLPTNLFIGGVWRESSDRRRFDVVDPATEHVLTSVADGTVADAVSAVDAAAAALPAWAARAPRERAEILRKAFEVMIGQKERIARLITLENGKALPDSRAEAAYAAEFFRWYAEEAVRNIGQLSRAPSSGARILVQHKPAGVAVLVTPWNFPAAMGTRKIAPALAAGCTVVLKPASETPLTMLLLAELLAEAGVPAGVVNILPARSSGAVVGAMLADPRVRVISFTGSTETGRRLLQTAAQSVVNPRMELGGNAPFIVFDDADLDAAVEGAMIAKMRNMGEACTAANRFYVQAGVYDEFVRRFAAAMAKLKVGNGLADGVAVGPLVNASSRDKVESLVDDARARGARVVLGGRRMAGPGYFLRADRARGRARRRGVPRRGDLRAGGATAVIPDRGRRHRARERYGVRARRLRVHARSRARTQGDRETRVRHGGSQSRPGLGSGRAVWRRQAVGSRARGRARGTHGVPRDAVRVRRVVAVSPRKR